LPSAAESSKINSSIGCPAPNCAITYSSNNIYVLHDNSVYELYNYNYTRISQNIAMKQVLDPDLYAADTYALTIFRERLFVRFFSNMYVYSLRTGMWSRWESERKFSRIITLPSDTVGLDTAFCSSASSADPGKLYFFRDDRVTGVGTDETYNCKIVTKTYDFDVPQSYKRMFWWGLTIATSGVTVVEANIPSSTQNYTWDYMEANYTWDTAEANLIWDNANAIEYPKTVLPTLGRYARKFLKLPKGSRFRQIHFEVDTVAVANTVGADASVRIFDLTVYLLERQTVFRETS
jgi:hypothetical protein